MSIQAELDRIGSARDALAASIAAKGVSVPTDATIDDMAALVDAIQTGGGTLKATLAGTITFTFASITAGQSAYAIKNATSELLKTGDFAFLELVSKQSIIG